MTPPPARNHAQKPHPLPTGRGRERQQKVSLDLESAGPPRLRPQRPKRRLEATYSVIEYGPATVAAATGRPASADPLESLVFMLEAGGNMYGAPVATSNGRDRVGVDDEAIYELPPEGTLCQTGGRGTDTDAIYDIPEP